ncbi:hypothetical protein Musp01_30420 [Muricauda sp. NBRC 101325]|nr:hypothetical protein Musp01_30420 [Muricauda sp. NBRC 101325]
MKMQLVFKPCCAIIFVLAHKKEKQEDSVLAQRYRSWLLRKALFMGAKMYTSKMGKGGFHGKQP